MSVEPFRELDITKYLGRPHNYGSFDCIKLIELVYAELGLEFSSPTYSFSRRWMREITTEAIDTWAAKYAKKVLLTEAKSYDVMVFTGRNKNPSHFGLFMAPSKLLHVEQSSVCRIDNLPYHETLYAVYRHKSRLV